MPGLLKKSPDEEPRQYRGPPRWLPPRRQRGIRNRRLRYHKPGGHHIYCPCLDCHMFYTMNAPDMDAEVATLEVSRPKYSYMCLVDALRDAAAKRDEERQEKLRAEREAAAAAVEASKKDKASKDQPKND